MEAGVGLMHNKRGLLRLFGDWDYGVCLIAGGVRGESVADIVVDGGDYRGDGGMGCGFLEVAVNCWCLIKTSQ
ncbi:hypothetical protein D1093_09620 [Bartonella kosoyi]|uniref:Uncharacterized protein n=1 Tax=Bartonella kosoyi TaxID=2133959 RepID=A0A5B9CZB7_9HYPH|nr:hypothetical protein [Bartonella kosoyi]QEE09806.1 hypothetical protein D1093_09620 [Bartonella kosoyi]